MARMAVSAQEPSCSAVGVDVKSELEKLTSRENDTLAVSTSASGLDRDPISLMEERAEEREVLSAVFGDDFKMEDEEGHIINITIRPNNLSSLCDPESGSEWFVPLTEMKKLKHASEVRFDLCACLTEAYPNTPPMLALADPRGLLSSAQRFELMEQLDTLASGMDFCMMYQLVLHSQEYLYEALQEDLENFKSMVVVDPFRKKWRYRNRTEMRTKSVIASHQTGSLAHKKEEEEKTAENSVQHVFEDWRKGCCQTESLAQMMEKSARDSARYDFEDWRKEFMLRCGTDEFTPHPSHFVGAAPIFRALREAGKVVVSMENVMRSDLAGTFLRQWVEYGRRYGTERNAHICPPAEIGWPLQGGNGGFSFLSDGGSRVLGVPKAQPVMAFHGTCHSALHSIVRNGLVVPGKRVEVRCGSSLGRGIYVSPRASFCMGYSDSGRLIVCAVLMGCSFVGGHCGGTVEKGYDSHTDWTCFNEWVLFDEACILPCWIIEYEPEGGRSYSGVNMTKSGLIVKGAVDFGSTLTEVRSSEMTEDEVKRKAAFWFGPKRQVLAVAEHDDDDDDYEIDTRNAEVLSEWQYLEEVTTEDGEFGRSRYEKRDFGRGVDR